MNLYDYLKRGRLHTCVYRFEDYVQKAERLRGMECFPAAARYQKAANKIQLIILRAL